MDVYMGQDLQSFVLSLEQKGFTTIAQDGKDASMYGNFANSEVSLAIMSTPRTKLVYCVFVFFQQIDSWKILEGQYKNLKVMLTERYGKPAVVEESFGNGYSIDNAYWAFMAEKATYITSYEPSGGEISLSIVSPYSIPYGKYPSVLLMYQDNANKIIAEYETMSDL